MFYLLWILIIAFAVFGLVLFFEGFATYIERKVSADIQLRIGPNRAGPLGLLQFIADGIKLILKEDLIPVAGDRMLFRTAPYIAFLGSFVAFGAIPFSENVLTVDMNIGLLFVLGFSGLVAIAIIFGGWASANKWSLLGGMRSAAQIVSYELPVFLSFLIPVTIAGSLSLRDISLQQRGLVNWFIFHNPFAFLAFVVAFVASVAECNRTPFDLPEAESELVAGYHTEYSGMRFAIWFMGEYGEMLLVSLLLTITFLGAWDFPFVILLKNVILRNMVEILFFIGKGISLVLVMMWIRWTLPRLRIDQLTAFSWGFLLPLSFINLIGNTLWLYLFNHLNAFKVLSRVLT